jgi:hypothetical protein
MSIVVLRGLEEKCWKHLIENPYIKALLVYGITLELDMCTLGV